MSMADVFALIDAVYREQVKGETWGHLAPKRNAKYHGRIVWAIGIYDSGELNPTPLHCELTSKTAGDLSDSPWFYDAIMEWLSKPNIDAFHKHERPYKCGCVYEFTGYFMNYEFVGNIREVFNSERTQHGI